MHKEGPSTKGMNAPITDEVLGLEPVCEHDPYPRYQPGTYELACTGAAIYRDPKFKAWKCKLDFKMVPCGSVVSGFFHLGRGDRPSAGRSSRYRHAWIIAAGAAPRKRQALSSRVFKGKLFKVEIADVVKRFDQTSHPEGARYSTVQRIISRTYP